MINTVVKCPGCAGATHSASIASDAEISGPRKYLMLTCQTCNSQLMFVVDLLPDFERCVDTLTQQKAGA